MVNDVEILRKANSERKKGASYVLDLTRNYCKVTNSSGKTFFYVGDDLIQLIDTFEKKPISENPNLDFEDWVIYCAGFIWN